MQTDPALFDQPFYVTHRPTTDPIPGSRRQIAQHELSRSNIKQNSELLNILWGGYITLVLPADSEPYQFEDVRIPSGRRLEGPEWIEHMDFWFHRHPSVDVPKRKTNPKAAKAARANQKRKQRRQSRRKNR